MIIFGNVLPLFIFPWIIGISAAINDSLAILVVTLIYATNPFAVFTCNAYYVMTTAIAYREWKERRDVCVADPGHYYCSWLDDEFEKPDSFPLFYQDSPFTAT